MDANSTMQTHRIETFLREFTVLVCRRRAADVKRMTAFLGDFRIAIHASSSTAKFNILDLTGVGSDEVKHSSILAWLFDPGSRHACGTRFLRALLKAASIPVSEEDICNCYVRTEFSGSDSIIDILIANPGTFLVYLENKTVSPEGKDQIDREYRDMLRLGESLCVPKNMMFPVFLTPSGRRPTSGRPEPWRTVSYRELAREFQALLSDIPDQKTVFLVEDLIGTYKRWGGS